MSVLREREKNKKGIVRELRRESILGRKRKNECLPKLQKKRRENHIHTQPAQEKKKVG